MSLILVRDALIFSSLMIMLSAGLTLTYMTTKVPNFAHGDFATLNIYLNLALVRLLNINPYLGTIPAFMLGGVIALVLYLAVLKPLMDRGANYVILMVATIAYDMILISLINIFADYLNRVHKIITRLFQLKGFDIEIFGQPGLFVIAPILAFVMITLLYFFLNKTKFGIAMRAAIENPSLAEVVGININRMYAISWFISGGLAGAVGALMPLYMTCNPDIGIRLLISIFAASILGGLSNIYGAFVGGAIIGLAEVLGTGYLSMTLGPWVVPYRPVIPLIVMMLTLLIAPRGLAGVNWKKFLRKVG
ncbi:MAG: branched-chain amino acid ABC transporter permease [Thaumarchaeota archaeon]|nr:branched-chain amino acid ABC transporter permease [Candidatus Terraquivivens yellowstonensis]MCL7388218.1 branched-chain amino acid ABC transporter permease [Candidatus Terraquivivens yellowstonensis]MCL7392012.1 branched-chain amino acid ABC transporter permease [Candidatus Terraquivivens yellowstonensis]MCL7394974.1 branched-chain amino acid ABC transporter permease [Candidatus Terraquivivens yellowstonensis]MCL7397768.1 branched-chain amino acid ABC transporter permease [Candidatus Terra